MIDHQVAELVVLGLVVALGDDLGDLRVELPAVVRAQDVDVVGRDVVVGEQRSVGSERRDPLAVVDRKPCLNGSLGEGSAVVGRGRDLRAPGRDRDLDDGARGTHSAYTGIPSLPRQVFLLRMEDK